MPFISLRRKMEIIIYLAIFLIVPIIAFVLFVVSLVRCVRTPAGSPKRRARKITAVISGIVAAAVIGAAVLAAIAFIAMLYGALSHM